MRSVTTPPIRIIPSTIKMAASYNRAVGQVARERRYLATTRPFTLQETKKYISRIMASGAVQFFAIDARMNVIGWCDVAPKEFEGMEHIGMLGMGVLEEYRGRGVGRRLLQHTLSKAASRGLKKVELEVFASNTVALRLYETAGFHREGMRKNARELDGTFDDIIMMAIFL